MEAEELVHVAVAKSELQSKSNKMRFSIQKVECKPKARALFIELKGGALNDAMNQIHSTIIYLKDELDGWQLDARIVSSGNVPDIKSLPNYQKLNKTVRKTGGALDRKTLYYNENC